MLQSSPPFLKCYECKKSPKEFTFLLCNHIICGNCIAKTIQITEKYNLVKCSCGSLTYFNQNSEIIEDYEEQKSSKNIRHTIQNDGQQYNVSRAAKSIPQRRSITADQSQRNSSDNAVNIDYPTYKNNNKESRQTLDHGSKTLINERSTMPMLEVSEVFSLQRNNDSSQQDQKKQHHLDPFSPLKQRYITGSQLPTQLRQKLMGTDKTKYDQSLLLDNFECSFEPSSKKKQEKRGINQFSTMEIRAIEEQERNEAVNRWKKSGMKEKSFLKSQDVIKDVNNIYQRAINKNNNTKTANKTTSNLIHREQANSPIDNRILLAQQTFTNPSSSPINTPQVNTPTAKNHSQFRSEMDFLTLIFNKDLEELQFQFDKLVAQLTKSFHKLEEELRSLYVEQVITKESILSLNLSSLVKNRYEKTIGEKFKSLKDQLFVGFYKKKDGYDSRNDHQFGVLRKHNQNLLQKHLKPFDSPLLQAYKLKNLALNPSINDSLNDSNVHDQNDHELRSESNKSSSSEQSSESKEQKFTTKHRYVPVFQTIEQKLERMTTKHQPSNKGSLTPKNIQVGKHNKTDLVKLYNNESSKRIQTQNIHTSIKRVQSHKQLQGVQKQQYKMTKPYKQKQNRYEMDYQNRHNRTQHHSPPSQTNQYRLTEKPSYKRPSSSQQLKQRHTHTYMNETSSPQPQAQSPQHPQRQIIYYSPPLPYSPPVPYCYKHLMKKQRQAKNYINYIEKLCHEKRMRNTQELFKKVRRPQERGQVFASYGNLMKG